MMDILHTLVYVCKAQQWYTESIMKFGFSELRPALEHNGGQAH